MLLGKYNLCKDVMKDDGARKGFDELIQQTFGLSFEKWYQNGEWSEWNQPYTLFDGDKAVANVTVNHMKALYQGKERNYIQLGGVATDLDYRNQGLSRMIMEEVLADWKNRCDAMFLMANHSVTEFYPKFGFVEETQYCYRWKKSNECKRDLAAGVRTLDLTKQEDKDILARCYQKQNPFSAFQFIDNYSLLQFYCYYGMDEAMYYIEEEDAVIVAEYDDNTIECYDVYYQGDKSMLQLMEYLLNNEITEVAFLFTPNDKQGLDEEKYEDEDTHLFVLSDKENVFASDNLFVPEISHT